MSMTMTEEKAERVLNVIDRCDVCGSQAFVLVKLITGEVMFCGHHPCFYDHHPCVFGHFLHFFEHHKKHGFL